jgi:glycosyltransferase involved in cell wall biosynthesis
VKRKYKIGYIGTVAEWFDFELLRRSLLKYEFLSYYIIGPCCCTLISKTERLVFVGTIEHEKLYDTVKDYDCLVMPFLLNDTTEAVDPVKLYEYISFGKCIISIYYDEIERFRDFVYFYHNQEEYNQIIQVKSQDGFKPKYNRDQQEKFLKQNTWEERFKVLKDVISRKIKV